MAARFFALGFALAATLAVGCANEDPMEEIGEVELIGRDWVVPAGAEIYRCVGIPVERDMYVSGFRTDNPLGEHHTVLTVLDEPGAFGTQLGEHDCEVLTVGFEMIYASGVGNASLELPEGVALKVEAGQYLHLNLHLFNSTDEDLAAHSAIRATLVEPVPPEREAEMVFTGTFDIEIPPGETGTATGGCTFPQDATLFAYWPHMHQYATHQKIALTVGGEELVLDDGPYDFEEQTNYPLDPPLEVSEGDSVQVECTYDNTSDTTLRWGDSSTEEMCFVGLYRYPKHAFTLFDCTEGGRP